MNKIFVVPNGFKDYCLKNNFSLEYRVLDLNGYNQLRLGSIPNVLIDNKHSYSYNQRLLNFLPYLEIKHYQSERLNALVEMKKKLKIIDLHDVEFINVYANEKNEESLKTIDFKNIKINCFDNIILEVVNLFEQLIKKINNNINLNDISIIVTDEMYLSYLEIFSFFYKIPLKLDYDKKLRNLDWINHFIIELEQTKNLEQTYEEFAEKPYIDSLVNIINNCEYDNIEQLTIILKQSLNKKIDNYQKLDNVIRVFNLENFIVNEHNFVLGVMDTFFPKTLKQEEILTMQELNEINFSLNDMMNKNHQLQIALLTNIANVYYSSCKTNFKNEFKQIDELAEIINYSGNVYTFNSLFYGQYAKQNNLDNYANIPFKLEKYNFNINTEIQVNEELSLSFSSIDKYINCPYAFYTQYYLRLYKKQPNFSLLGTFMHYVLEIGIDQDLDELDLNDLLNDYLKKNDVCLEPIELLILKNKVEKLSSKILLILENLQDLKANNYEIYTELKQEIQLIDQVVLTGTIDLLIKTNNGDIIIDYKQKKIPKSLKLLEKFNNYSELQNFIYLLFINDQILATLRVYIPIDEDFQTFGVVNNDSPITFLNGDKIEKSDLEEIKIKTKEKLEIVAKNIKNGKFKINPRKEACKYCPYYDCCFIPAITKKRNANE